MSGIGARNPITKEELERFRRSLKIGDSIIYPEVVSGDEGLGGSRIVKIPMQITGIYRNCITLEKGKVKRSLTIPEALIYSMKRQPVKPKEEPREISLEERKKRIMNLAYRGFSNAEIAQKTGCSIKTVSGVIRSAIKKKEKTNARHAQIIKLKISGHGVNEIARTMGCSSSTVIRVTKKYLEGSI